MQIKTNLSYLIVLLAGALLWSACSGSAGSSTNSVPSVLGPNQKADDFRSQSAQEYYATGRTTITLPDTYRDKTKEQQLKRIKELIPYKQVVIGYFLNTFLVDKSSDAENADYGGMKALTKNGSYEMMDIKRENKLTYSFKFKHEIGGQMKLLSALRRQADARSAENGNGLAFELAVGDLSIQQMTQLESGNEWYRNPPWSDFSPNNVESSKYYQQTVVVKPQSRSKDAWVEYNRLFEDGQVDMGLYFGWDYHGNYHQKHAKQTYDWLLEHGFQSPVNNWEAYAKNRAPLTKSIQANGRAVRISVTLWWGEPGTETDPSTTSGARVLEQKMKESLRNDEIVAYSGHSGPWYGFELANWKKTPQGEGNVDDAEIPKLDLPSDKYQIVLASGCDTYALGEAFWNNPNKSDRKSLDIITTTSFSDATSNGAITDTLEAIIQTDESGRHVPIQYSDLLGDLDSNSAWSKAMYGVHGIDNNPHGHPYGNRDKLCQSCSGDSACGGHGNLCVNLDGSKVCTFECTADDGCPSGYTCRQTQTNGDLGQKVCVPESLSCSAP